MNLVDEVGLAYFSERFRGIMFEGPNGKPCFISPNGIPRVLNNVVPAIQVEGTPAKPSTTNIELPYDFFTGMEVFAAPEIGWRQAHNGRYLAYFERNNGSYVRGLALGNMGVHYSDVSRWAADNGMFSLDWYERDLTKVLLAMRPEFTPLKEGIGKIMEGTMLAFAVSSRLAVVPDTGDTLAILFNRNKVGMINANGEINCSIPFVNKSLTE